MIYIETMLATTPDQTGDPAKLLLAKRQEFMESLPDALDDLAKRVVAAVPADRGTPSPSRQPTSSGVR